MERLPKLISAIAAAVLALSPAYSENIPDKKLIESFRQNPYRAAAGHTPYEAPVQFVDTPAPKGYKAFNVSHIGRHSSRYQANEGIFCNVCEEFDDLYEKGLLTSCGDSLRRELQHMWDVHKKQMCGMLTLKGSKRLLLQME